MLEAAGTSIDNVVKVNIFIADIKDFAAMNEVYMQYFGDVKPARRSVKHLDPTVTEIMLTFHSCVQALPPVPGLPVEIECTAVLP